MAAVHAEDVHTYFLFVGDLNGHNHEWLGSTTKNRQGIAAFAGLPLVIEVLEI